MTENHLVTANRKLSICAPGETWIAILDKELGREDDFESFDVPAELSLAPDNIIAAFIDAEMRKEVTPEMRAQHVTPPVRYLLAHITDMVKEARDNAMDSEPIIARMATLLCVEKVPLPIILNTYAEARETGGSFWQKRLEAHGALFDLKYHAECGSRNAGPQFDHDEFGRMATYVHAQGLETVTASSEREFFNEGRRIPTHGINSIIQAVLESCVIWDSLRDTQVLVSNRLIAEVRGALARKWPQWSTSGRAEDDPTRTSYARPDSESVSSFADELLELQVGAWTASATLTKVWRNWCASQDTAPGEPSWFFRELGKWSGGRAHRRKKQTESGRVPGYAGIRLR